MLVVNRSEVVKPSHSRKAAVKLMQRLPSHIPLPCLTTPGMFLVSSSSSLCRIPFWLRKPTIILGTPSKNDCIQNFSNLRSYLSISLSFAVSAVVFNSTQLMGSSLSSGLQSHTEQSLATKNRGYCLEKCDNIRASTSPPMINFVLPMPVFTTEQYWA